jgi:hypothetical protein
MPLSEDNQNWVRTEIQAALYPNGAKRVASWLRYWGVLGVCVTAFIALIAIVVTLGIFTTNRIGQESEFRGTTQTKLTNIETKLGGIEKDLLALRVAQAAHLPIDKKSIAEATAILDTAKRSEIKLPTDVVEQSGNAFINAASKEPAAWNTALKFISYRSTLNVYVRTVSTVAVPEGAQTTFNLGPALNGKSLPQLSHVSAGVAPADAARFEKIGQNLNQQLAFGSAQLILNGGAISLDDRLVKHAILAGVEVHYTGKAILLQDVVFINCTFLFENSQPARQLGQILLASQNINFEKAI